MKDRTTNCIALWNETGAAGLAALRCDLTIYLEHFVPLLELYSDYLWLSLLAWSLQYQSKRLYNAHSVAMLT
jgi:hypothetical protein